MTLTEALFRWAIYVRFGRNSVAADIITDYLDIDPPDYRAARRAWHDLARWHRCPYWPRWHLKRTPKEGE